MDKSILILQRILPHYRIGFFRAFCRRFPGSKILYGQTFKQESLKNAYSPDESIFIFCKNIYFGKSGKIFLSKIFSKLRQFKPEVVISVFNVGNLNIYLLFVLRKILKFKLILWSFGYDPGKGFNPDKRFTDKVRLYLSQKADAVIFYWEAGRVEAAKHSKKTGHYFVAPNTLDTDIQFGLKGAFDRQGRYNIRKELGISERFHFIYVGRLLEDKEVDLLLRAFCELEKRFTDIRLTIIGDGPEKESLKKLSIELKLKNVSFAGEITDVVKTGKWIYISDAFIMPGRLGLSVVHSFCYGTPVISQKKEKHFHGEGIGYMKDGVNGYLVKDGSFNEISDRMSDIIKDEELSGKLRMNAFETARNECSVENMLGGFEKAIRHVTRNS